jgi:spermidine synthase
LTRYWWSERVGPGFVHGYEVDLLYEARSPYQHILILHSPFWGRVLVLDGVVQLTEKDEFIYHEMIVHVPFLGRKTPVKSALIIGGADGGALRETLSHASVERVVQVELDAAVITACRKYLPEICAGWDDPRVELIIGDGAVFVEDAAARGDTFDVIILDSTDPIGPAVVLFEKPFHRNLAACLSKDGVLVRQSGLPLTMPLVMPFLWARISEVLPRVEVYRAPVPSYGDEMAFLAGTKDGSRVQEPHGDLVGRFYDPACHRAAFALPVWWRDLIENYQDDGEVPVESPY